MNRYSQIKAIVTHGRGLGHKIGFPTANVALPANYDGQFGVFLATVTVDADQFYAVLSIGCRPTVADNEQPNAECYILDFERNIYGQTIIITPLQYLRPEVRFSCVEKLIEQIQIDVNEARKIILTINTKSQKTMEKSLKGTRTEKNLLASFAGESQARNRYNFFASQARKDGYEVIAKFFDETAENERQHAKQFFKLLEGGVVEITASYPAGSIGTTAENLLAAAQGEYEEWHDLYPEAARIAEEEGFPKVAAKFRQITAIEKHHEARYRGLLETVEAKTVFQKAEEQVWRCRECGHEHIGSKALEMCPVCQHPQSFQEIKSDKY